MNVVVGILEGFSALAAGRESRAFICFRLLYHVFQIIS